MFCRFNQSTFSFFISDKILFASLFVIFFNQNNAGVTDISIDVVPIPAFNKSLLPIIEKPKHSETMINDTDHGKAIRLLDFFVRQLTLYRYSTDDRSRQGFQDPTDSNYDYNRFCDTG